MRRFESAASAQRFLGAFSRVGNLIRPGPATGSPLGHTTRPRARMATWRPVAAFHAA
jgi:hypothetical protein